MLNVHNPTGPVYQAIQRCNAELCLQSNELEAIYYLSESHTPGMRFKADARYEKSVVVMDHDRLTLNKHNFIIKCHQDLENKLQIMIERIAEMPKEWTIVQITPHCNLNTFIEVDPEQHHTDALYISVFDCGQKQSQPFCVTVDPPTDKFGNKIEILQEVYSIIKDNKEGFANIRKQGLFKTLAQKQKYCEYRSNLNSRLKVVTKTIQEKWLREWRCLLTGKFVNRNIVDKINEKIKCILNTLDVSNVSEKTSNLLLCIIKGSPYLSLQSLKKCVQVCFPDVDGNTCTKIVKLINDIKEEYRLDEEKRHPVILVVDDKLDIIPWEMLDVLQEHPVSRVPSVHIIYALYKEYEDSIVDGLKVGINPTKGGCIINPGLDLKQMEVRLTSFFKYWAPEWKKIIGSTPTSSEFQNMLTEGDIFVYNGHGNGTQFFGSEKIERIRIKTVVILFGCGSVGLTNLGPATEMYGTYQMYLIACSPCVLGMLWDVTDNDTDTLATELLSQWLPSKALVHWKMIDKKRWISDGEIVPDKNGLKLNPEDQHEPELLRALNKARKPVLQYLVQAAFVARGLPVKIAS